MNNSINQATLGNDDIQIIVQNPSEFFTLPSLQTAAFRKKAIGTPMSWSGARAIVFCAKTSDDEVLAVRFPRTISASIATRYDALGRHLSSYSNLPLVDTNWFATGALRSSGEAQPIITMEWVEGLQLDRYIDKVLTQRNPTSALASLARSWLTCMDRLGEARIGHGDVHAGNILVNDVGSNQVITLVDYDCVWVPGLHVAGNETGLAAFQHPAGLNWGQHMDAFPSTVVYLCLRALDADPGLWPPTAERANDRLLFEPSDFIDPAQSDMFQRIDLSPEHDVRSLSRLLKDWARGCPDDYPSLSDAIAQAGVGTSTSRLNVWVPLEAADPQSSDTASSPAATPAPALNQVWKPESTEGNHTPRTSPRSGAHPPVNRPPPPISRPYGGSAPPPSAAPGFLESLGGWIVAHPVLTVVIVLFILLVLIG